MGNCAKQWGPFLRIVYCLDELCGYIEIGKDVAVNLTNRGTGCRARPPCVDVLTSFRGTCPETMGPLHEMQRLFPRKDLAELSKIYLSREIKRGVDVEKPDETRPFRLWRFLPTCKRNLVC